MIELVFDIKTEESDDSVKVKIVAEQAECAIICCRGIPV